MTYPGEPVRVRLTIFLRNLFVDMHLLTILAFAILFLRADEGDRWRMVPADDVFWTLTVVLIPTLLGAAIAYASARRVTRALQTGNGRPEAAQLRHHRILTILRFGIGISFAGSVFLTRWPDWFNLGSITPALQIVGDLAILSPYFSAMIALWVASFPLDEAIRIHTRELGPDCPADHTRRGRFRSYLIFQIRHQLLIIAVPMTIILFTSNLTRGHEESLRSWTHWSWTPDVLLGIVAGLVFLLAPLMLMRIWHTVRLEDGPVRQRLESIALGIDLRFRDILIWKSDGTMINAAVMGIISPVRYVLLSDALLESMTQREVEAVFGHEAGHVRHRHIQHFLVFAVVGWLLVAAIMEGSALVMDGVRVDPSTLSPTIQGVGIVATILFWWVGFGWLSRRFEWQADRFGASCVAPEPAACLLPCSVHPDEHTTIDDPGRVCATGAAIFATALDKVALLNGIPHEERSWRHASIGSRIRLLTSLAGDPRRAVGFERQVRRVKTILCCAAVIGAGLSILYCLQGPPAILGLQVGGG